jgi:hypothetical protein
VLFVWCVDCGEFILGVKTKTARHKQIALLCLTYEYVKEQCSPKPLLEVCRTSVLYGKVCLGPSFCSEQAYCGCDLPVRGGSAGQVPGGKVTNGDERAYIDALFFPNRRTSNSASSFYLTDFNHRLELQLQNTGRLAHSNICR